MGDWQAMLNDATAFAAKREEFDRDGYMLFESVLEPKMRTARPKSSLDAMPGRKTNSPGRVLSTVG